MPTFRRFCLGASIGSVLTAAVFGVSVSTASDANRNPPLVASSPAIRIANMQAATLSQSSLPPETRQRLAEASRSNALAPWQRQFMAGLARDGHAGMGPGGPVDPGRAASSDRATATDGSWVRVGSAPSRYYHTAIYDPVRDRMVVFGGEGGGHFSNEVWTLSLAGNPKWTLLTPAGTPPSERSAPAAIYDPVRDRMVVFGGYRGGFLNDLWELSLADSPEWKQLTPAGTSPTGRYFHTAIYDPVRDRMVVFGGFSSYVLLNDVWELSLAGSPEWKQLTPAGTPPSGRYCHTAIYDPVRDRMVVFGGSDFWSSVFNDVWALSLAGSPEWTQLTPAGTAPSQRYSHTAIYDPVRDRMVVFGGFDGDVYLNDVCSLSLAGNAEWTQLTPAGPPNARSGHTAIYDPLRDRMIMFGGGGFPSLQDVWALSLAGSPEWSLLPTGTSPSERYGHSAIYDPLRDRMVVFGGYDYLNESKNDVWALGPGGSPEWKPIAPAGTPPSGRDSHSAIYDPVRDRMVIFGGYDSNADSYLNDVWSLSLAGNPEWTQLTPAGTPPVPQSGHTAIYDSVRDRMIVFGGAVWALSLAENPEWTELTPAGPGPILGPAIYDSVRDRMIVFGGGVYDNQVWALSLAGSPQWTQLTPAGTPPSGRSRHTAIYDTVRDRMVVFGGATSSGYLNDVWALSLGGSPQWTQLTPAGTLPNGRNWHSAIYDPVLDGMVVFGGDAGGSYFNDVWDLLWGPLTGVEGVDVPKARLSASVIPNPLNPAGVLRFRTLRPGPVRVKVFDPQGRLVRVLMDTRALAEGVHTLPVDGRGERGQVLASGIYFYRVEAAEGSVAGRIVILK